MTNEELNTENFIRFVMLVLLFMISHLLSSQSVLDVEEPEKLIEIMESEVGYPYTVNDEVVMKIAQFNKIWILVQEGQDYRLRNTSMDSLVIQHKEEVDRLTGAMILGGRSLNTVVETNKAISNIGMENFTTNTQNYSVMTSNYSELVKGISVLEGDKSFWKKWAGRLGVIAIIEGIILGIILI